MKSEVTSVKSGMTSVKSEVTSVKSEDGFRAWFQLRMRFEPSVAARQGIVLADFSGMVSKPAKNPMELMSMITDRRRS